MTFFEAAVEVLRRTGRPLHYKKITEVAVRDELLSHVGKSPDETMSTRLTQEVRRHGESVIVETRPGVYTIREAALAKLNQEAQKRERREEARRSRLRRSQGEEESEAEVEAEEKNEEQEETEEPKRRRSRRRSRRSQNKGGDSKGSRNKRSQDKRGQNKRSKSKKSRSSKGKSSGRKKARGSSRRSRGSKRDQEAESAKSSDSSKKSRRSKGSDSEQDSRRSGGNKRRRSRSKSKGKSRSRRRSRSGRQQKQQQKTNGATTTVSNLTKHLEEGPVRLDGIAHAAYTVLQDGKTKPIDIEDLADDIFERKLVKFHTHDPAATVQAALANDNQIRRQRGHRPLFTQYDQQRWGLTEWGLPNDAIAKEQTILSLSEEIRQETLGHLGEALIDVKDEALEHIALTLLERLGYQNIKVSKRSSEGDVYFTADWRQGLADVRVCIQVTLEAEDELEANAVSALRDTLHHYSAAEGVIIHLGDISRDAIVESRHEDKAPITLIDRTTFVELLIKHGIGVQAYTTPILMVDTAFIETLKS